MPGNNWPLFEQEVISDALIDFCSTPKSGHSEAHAGLPVMTQLGHSGQRVWLAFDWRTGTAATDHVA